MLDRLPDWLRRAVRVALWSFVGLFGLALTGWLYDVLAWASSEQQVDFPSLTVLGKALVAAAVSAVIGLIGAVVNFAEDHTRMPAVLKAPPSPGRNPEPDGGYTVVELAVVVVLVLLAALLVLELAARL